jgi:hypothetical protein
MYCRVVRGPEEDPLKTGMYVTERKFDKQLRFFKREFDVLPLSEAVECIRDSETLPRKTISITFDDGYLDNLKVRSTIHRFGRRRNPLIPSGRLTISRRTFRQGRRPHSMV